MKDQRDIPLTHSADADLDIEGSAEYTAIYLTGAITAARALGMMLSGACEGAVRMIKVTRTTAFAWTVKNGSASAGTTIATFPAGATGFCVLKFSGSAWELVGGVNLDEQDNELRGSATWNPGDLADGAGETKDDFTVTGAAFGDVVDVAAPYSLQGITCTGYVHAADTVAVRLQNETGGAINLASGTWLVTVRKAKQ